MGEVIAWAALGLFIALCLWILEGAAKSRAYMNRSETGAEMAERLKREITSQVSKKDG